MNMKKENPLTVQSKQWILEALLKLMEEKNYEKITIKELTARADLDRKTFYRNFRSKEEVLYLQLQEFHDSLDKRWNGREPGGDGGGDQQYHAVTV